MRKWLYALLAVVVVWAVGSAWAEVNFTPVDNLKGRPPSWAKRITPTPEGGGALDTHGRQLNIPDPTAGWIYRAGTDSFDGASVWNFANFPKDKNRYSLDIGKQWDDSYFFIAIGIQFGSLADHVNLPLAEFINPRLSIQGGYDTDGYERHNELENWDWGGSLVVVQLNF